MVALLQWKSGDLLDATVVSLVVAIKVLWDWATNVRLFESLRESMLSRDNDRSNLRPLLTKRASHGTMQIYFLVCVCL